MPPGTIPEPTAEQCSTHAAIQLTDGRTGYACWFPQTGGYSGKALAVPDLADDDGPGDGPDVYVWHDGEFPFSDGSPGPWGDPRGPAVLHFCDPAQFVSFGLFLASIEDGTPPPPVEHRRHLRLAVPLAVDEPEV